MAAHLEGERRRDRALSWEGLIARVVLSLDHKVRNDLLLVKEIAEAVNADREEKEQLSSRRIGTVLRSLGFTVKTAHANKAALVWDQAKVDAVAAQYAEAPPADRPGVGSADANQPNPDDGTAEAETVSVVRKVSVGGWGRGRAAGGGGAATDDADVLDAAEARGWPTLRLPDGRLVRGEERWRLFVHTASPGELRSALDALEETAERPDQVPF